MVTRRQVADREIGSPNGCPPLERAVVRFVRDLSFDSLGMDVRAAASRLIRDQLAVQIGSPRLPWSRQVLAFALERHRPGRSSETRFGAPPAGLFVFRHRSYTDRLRAIHKCS